VGSGDHHQTGTNIMLNIKYRYLAVVTLGCACASFIFCLLYSFIFHFEEVTSTHCNVWNGAPSVSSSIGSNAPQRYVWSLVMALHTGPKLLLCAMYHSVNTARDQFRLLGTFNSFLSFLELISLLMVSVVPSIELYDLHIFATGVFLFSSAFHMGLSCYLTKENAHSHLFKMGLNHFQLRKSLHYKQVLLLTHYLSIVISLYFYWRHNAYCEPGIYSVFSLCEYIVILSNMAYHATSYFDFYHVNINLANLL